MLYAGEQDIAVVLIDNFMHNCFSKKNYTFASAESSKVLLLMIPEQGQALIATGIKDAARNFITL